jgi:hypothetical protein
VKSRVVGLGALGGEDGPNSLLKARTNHLVIAAPG